MLADTIQGFDTPDEVAQMDDWTTQAADAVERAVGMVRDRTVGPAQRIVKMAIYGLLAAILALTAFVLLTILVLRLLNLFLPDWAAWMVLGVLFLIAGGVLFTIRNPRPAKAAAALAEGNKAPRGSVSPRAADAEKV